MFCYMQDVNKAKSLLVVCLTTDSSPIITAFFIETLSSLLPKIDVKTLSQLLFSSNFLITATCAPLKCAEFGVSHE